MDAALLKSESFLWYVKAWIAQLAADDLLHIVDDGFSMYMKPSGGDASPEPTWWKSLYPKPLCSLGWGRMFGWTFVLTVVASVERSKGCISFHGVRDACKIRALAAEETLYVRPRLCLYPHVRHRGWRVTVSPKPTSETTTCTGQLLGM